MRQSGFVQILLNLLVPSTSYLTMTSLSRSLRRLLFSHGNGSTNSNFYHHMKYGSRLMSGHHYHRCLGGHHHYHASNPLTNIVRSIHHFRISCPAHTVLPNTISIRRGGCLRAIHCQILNACQHSAKGEDTLCDVVDGEFNEGVSDDVPFTRTDAFAAIELALDAVVKVFTVTSSPNYFLPWQNKPQREITGSGFVIPGRRILTNAHVVADQTFVLVRKHGSPTKYKAEVQAVGHECDLALLTVSNEEFWEGMNFLEFGNIPYLQHAVAVVGYPQGGDNISVTRGVVSRVELTQYTHGAAHLMGIQIDAAINPGNSGGPAIMDEKVAGVAFQNLAGAENIGYIIPVPIIEHFMADVKERGKYIGFCTLGVSCQPTENVQLRDHLKMPPGLTGVLVSKINPLSDTHRVLQKDDVIIAFDGIPIANDGTVHLRNRERITFDHLVSMKKAGEIGAIRVLRNGKEHEFHIKLSPPQPLVPVHQFDKLPSYFIFAGLVFTTLTQPYLHEYGDDWYNTSPRRLCDRALNAVAKKYGEQLIILSQVLMDDINTGYERLADLQVKKVNGVEVDNLTHLRQLVESCKEKSIRFDLDDERVIVLNYDAAKDATSRILKRYRIPSAISLDLLEELECEERYESEPMGWKGYVPILILWR